MSDQTPGSDPTAGVKPATRQANWQMVGKLTIMIFLMFGFGYAMVPIYKAICDVTGVNFLTRVNPENEKFAVNTQVDESRTVTVVFDSNNRGAMKIHPEIGYAEMHPGQLFTVVYDLSNTGDKVTSGQAIPSYAPAGAARYFRKIECFCFDQQTLEPHSQRPFQVVFVIDPDLPKDISTITLSYTYFEVGGIAAVPARPVAIQPVSASPHEVLHG